MVHPTLDAEKKNSVYDKVFKSNESTSKLILKSRKNITYSISITNEPSIENGLVTNTLKYFIAIITHALHSLINLCILKSRI